MRKLRALLLRCSITNLCTKSTHQGHVQSYRLGCRIGRSQLALFTLLSWRVVGHFLALCVATDSEFVSSAQFALQSMSDPQPSFGTGNGIMRCFAGLRSCDYDW